MLYKSKKKKPKIIPPLNQSVFSPFFINTTYKTNKIKHKKKPCKPSVHGLYYLTGDEGFEPPSTVLETGALPLN